MRYLVCRIAAIGDCLQVTPLLRYLKENGHEVYVLTSEQGLEIFKNNPFIDKLIYHKRDSVPCDLIGEYFEKIKKENNCNVLINLCESIEVKYLFHPVDPQYNYSKQERFNIGNKNHYDIVFEGSGFPEIKGKLPEMFFTEKEESDFANFRKEFIGKFLIVWCLAGSSLHKTYPYAKYVMEKLLNKYPDIVFVTVGDQWCEILELELEHNRIIHKSGKWNLRETALACKYASLVVAPETGVLHMSGCFDTPKIGFLTHTTKECLSKYFKNDYSLEAKVNCAPCFRIIYDAKVQCPIDRITAAPFCAAFGFNPDLVTAKIEEIYHK